VFVLLLTASDLGHGLMEAQFEHADKEVDGVPIEISFRPTPVVVFHQKARVLFEGKIAGFEREEIESSIEQQLSQGDGPCVADLFLGPACGAWLRMCRDCHDVLSSGVA